jgi:hypothetical protein
MVGAEIRRGERGGEAREMRGKPVGVLGWGWGGRRRVGCGSLTRWWRAVWSDEAGRMGLGRRVSVARGEPIPGASLGGGGPKGQVQHRGAHRRQWQPWELGCACRFGLGWPFIGMRGRGEVELDAVQQREARPGEGHGKGTASPACHGSAVKNRRLRGASASSMGGFRAGEGDSASSLSGPVGALPFGAARGRHRWPGDRRPLPLEERERVRA